MCGEMRIEMEIRECDILDDGGGWESKATCDKARQPRDRRCSIRVCRSSGPCKRIEIAEERHRG